ncbi:uncharacterized protein LACBIDRAFT_300520 [Laccaria bicolor S238N-H82]|uniref:Predicted protein n=1 Tax=Laccaria bicolor (strain S238N-H82 / ATCC MYA-4686) TaxID=486041 RepID=B0DGY6_LACBS|nr:uncharacterized protein LACBIDRAFT_300520 [Laccaria bicolor S238N-H82]EDR06232.1 predicted protein [Laccaria bicolor S238N-H82]|eukprot:XP_001883093.1 predicted protein [Laccaria bicolor S238N-H82]
MIRIIPYSLEFCLIVTYIETRGDGATIHPWFWIICLFIRPMLVSVAFQYYLYLRPRIVVHAEALITQLVLEHSLRIWLVAEDRRRYPFTTTCGSVILSWGGGERR